MSHLRKWIVGLAGVSLVALAMEVTATRLAAVPQQNNSAAVSSASAGPAAVPRLIKFSGTLLDAQGPPRKGPVGITFAIYKEQEGGAALWMETQNVELDEQGHYSVLLGATKPEGLPLELFTTGEPRWLGVQVDLPKELEQPRVLLVSVPYALKAADAETLGGKPFSAFVLATPPSEGGAGASKAPNAAATTAVGAATIGGGGTQNFVAKFDATGVNVINSSISDNGSRISAGEGIDFSSDFSFVGNADPAATGRVQMFDRAFVGFVVRGLNVLFETLQGSPAVPTEVMRVTQTGNVGIGTSAPGQKLEVAGNLKISGGGNALVFPDGSVMGSAATGVGGGTITGVTAGTGLTGGGTAGGVTLAINPSVVPQLGATTNTFTGNITGLSFTGSGAGLTNVNATMLNGMAAGAFAPASGSPNYVAKTGDTMTGTLNLPANGLVAGTSQLVLSGGNVGIGTTAPSARVHVLTPFGQSSNIFLENTGGSLLKLAGEGAGASVGTANNFTLDFLTNNSSRMRIDTVGNVGIGTTTPAHQLSVAGMIQSTTGGIMFPDGSTQTTASAGGTITGVTAGTGLTGGGTTGGVTLGIASGGVTNALLGANSVTNANIADGSLSPAKITGIAATLGPNSFIGDQSITGNVGIGGISSFARLNVVGTSGLGIFSQTSAGGGFSAVLGESLSTGSPGVLGQNFGGGGLPPFDTFNIGVAGQSNNGIGVDGSTVTGVAVRGRVTNTAGKLFSGLDPSGVEKFRVDSSGNIRANAYQNLAGTPIAQYITLQLYGANIAGGASFTTGGGAFAGMQLPNTGVPSFAFEFTIPPNYTSGNTLTVHVIWHTSATSCTMSLPPNFISVARAGSPHIQGLGASSGLGAVGGNTLNAPATANVSEEKQYTITPPDGVTPLQPGDVVIFGIFRTSSGASDCTANLTVQGVSVTY